MINPVIPLPLETATEKHATHQWDMVAADLTAAANTQTLSLINVMNKMGFELVGVELIRPFVSSDGTLVSTAITMGDGGSANRFLASMELNAAGAFVSLKGGNLSLNAVPYLYTVDDTVDVFVTGTGGKLLNTHTDGLARFYFKATRVPGSA
jgi:hypothetical protein